MVIKKSNSKKQIEIFLKNNFSLPTHWPEWNLLVSKYYGSDFFYYIAFDNDEITGICPAHINKNGSLENIFSGQFHYIPYGGWLFKRNDILTYYKYPLKYNQSITVFSIPDITKKYKINSGPSFFTLIIDLNKSLEEIWNEDINSKRRNMIRKAEKNAMQVKISYNNCNEIFYNFYDEFNRNNNLLSLPFSFFKDFNESKNIKITYFEAFYKEELLSITVTLSDKDYSIYWLGLNKKGAPNLGQGELLQWEAIKFAKNYGCRYYDLCYVEKERLPHIYEFKKGFSKREVNVPLFNNKTVYYKIINRINKCF